MKKLLLTLFVGFVGIISFCSANIVSISMNCNYVGGWNECSKGNLYSQQLYLDKGDYLILIFGNDGSLYKDFSTFRIVVSDDDYTSVINYTTGNNPMIYNILDTGLPLSIVDLTFFGKSVNFNGEIITVVFVPVSEYSSCSCPECPTCYPQYTSEECQSVYGLVSSGQYYSCQSDLSSCQSFTSGFNEQLINCNSELVSCNSSLTSCLQYNCPETELSYSNFYVRHGESTWFQLTGMENYYVYLPDYLSYNYDYSYGTDLNFTVGVSYDTGYINDINTIQNYQPTSDDFSKLVGLFGSYGGLLIACLFVIIVFYLIKKMFK